VTLLPATRRFADRPGVEAYSCYICGMARTRVSTTVDEGLLASARAACSDLNDAALLDAALEALLARLRAAEFDAGYAAYDSVPLDAEDDWGDLASFREAAAAS
jgi:antitoxin MazE5